MKKEEIVFLGQLVKTLQETSLKLEEAYRKSNYENFNKLKKFMLEVQDRISKTLK